MFDYTKETILNSVTESNVQAITGLLRIFRNGEYKVDYKSTNIVDGKVYRTKGTEGQKTSVVFTASAGNSSNKGKYRITINLKNNSRFLADYATAVWKFQKPVNAEVTIADGDSNTVVAQKIADAIKLAVPENYRFITVSVSSNAVTISGTDPTQIFDEVLVEKYVPNTVLPSEGEYVTSTEIGTFGEITPNIEPFATAAWLVENLRFPSYPNVRYNALNADETPIPGTIYEQFAFRYVAERKGLSGIGSVGQKLISVTNHIFYVPQNLAEQFATKIKTAFGDVSVIENKATVEIIGNDSITKNGEAVTLVANAFNNNGDPTSATFEWEIVDNPDSSNITLSGDQLTVQAGTAQSEFVVKVTATFADKKTATAQKTISIVEE